MSVEYGRDSLKVSGPELLDGVDLILFDLDGIIFHPHKTVVSELKKILVNEFGSEVDLNFSESQIAMYDHLSIWAKERGMDHQRAYALERTLWDNPELLTRCELIDGAKDLVDWLIDEKRKLVMAHTSRPSEELIARTTKKALEQVRPGLRVAMRVNNDSDRHMFKAKNAISRSIDYGRILAIEDMSSHAQNILTLADSYAMDIWVLLIPYGLSPVPQELLAHPRLISIERKSEDQGIRRAISYLKGEPI